MIINIYKKMRVLKRYLKNSYTVVNNSKGMSLLSVVIGSAIASIVLLSMSQIFTMTSQQIKMVNTKSDFEALRFELDDRFKNEATCTLQFQGSLVDVNNRSELLEDNTTNQNIPFANNSLLDTKAFNGIKTNQAFIKLLSERAPEYYSAFLMITAKKELPNGDEGLNYRALNIPMTVRVVGGAVQNCVSDSYEKLVTIINNPLNPTDPTNPTPASPNLGICPDNNYVKGFDDQGDIICQELVVSAGTPTDGATGWSITSPGKGCREAWCSTRDFGPCIGTGCHTNGNSCKGTRCRAWGPMASCSGTGCCAGPQCAPKNNP